MTSNFDVIGVGNPIVDLLANVGDEFISIIGGEKGGMVLVESANIDSWLTDISSPMNQSPGGSAGNTAFALARLGLRATFLGKIGNDAYGNFYRNSFIERGGDDSRFIEGGLPNGRCLSLVTPDSQRTMRTNLGAASTLAPEEIKIESFAGCRHAHIEGFLLFNPDLMMSVVKSAKAAGCSISIDLASFEVVRASMSYLDELLQNYVDIVFANEEEAAVYCAGAGTYAEQARSLAGDSRIGIVKVGKEGAFIAQGKEVFHSAALPGINAIDTTGAGDLWGAGFLYGYLNGMPLSVCGKYGSALGAEVVQIIGTEMPEPQWNNATREFGK